MLIYALLLLQGADPLLQDWGAALVAVFVFVVGGGTLGKWLAGKVRSGHIAETTTSLRSVFATHAELSGLRASLEVSMRECSARAEAASKIAELANSQADIALSLAQRLEVQQQEFHRRMTEDVRDPMQAMTEIQRRQGEALSSTAALLQRVTDQVDRMWPPGGG